MEYARNSGLPSIIRPIITNSPDRKRKLAGACDAECEQCVSVMRDRRNCFGEYVCGQVHGRGLSA